MISRNKSFVCIGCSEQPTSTAKASAQTGVRSTLELVKKVKASHTRYRALGPELIPLYRQSARRWL